MKIRTFRNAIITGVLCTALVIPSFAQAADIQPISETELEIVPISYKINHWAEPHIDQLLQKFNVASVFENKNLNAPATLEDFKNLVRQVIDEEYDDVPDAMTREAVVHKLTELWAEKTGKDLESIVTIQMLVYEDMDKIDAKYSHGIVIAYLHDIAKGKGSGIFDPKSHITYGELGALINNTHKAIEKELRTAEKAAEEGIFETRGSYTVEDGKVVFDFQLVNNSDEKKTLMFGSGQQFEITITDEKGTEVYRYSDGKFFTMALIFKDIDPGESLKWQDAWDMTNKDGEKAGPGKYRAEIEILVIQEEGQEPIDESQLKTVIDFELE